MMNRLELAERRGMLLERIARQRDQVADQARPFYGLLVQLDRIPERVRSVIQRVQSQPLLIGLGLGLILVFKPRRALRLAQYGFLAWRVGRWFKRRP